MQIFDTPSIAGMGQRIQTVHLSGLMLLAKFSVKAYSLRTNRPCWLHLLVRCSQGYKKTIYWFEKAATLGLLRAKVNLGWVVYTWRAQASLINLKQYVYLKAARSFAMPWAWDNRAWHIFGGTATQRIRLLRLVRFTRPSNSMTLFQLDCWEKCMR